MSSSDSSERSSLVNSGTVAVQLAVHTIDGLGREQTEEYHTISAQQDCANFSLEELRLEDYKRGYDAAPGAGDDHPALPSVQALKTSRQPDNKKYINPLSLLIGPAIEIRVSTATDVHDSTDKTTSWFLPKRLISHHSPFLEAACNRDFKERSDNLIELFDVDSIGFGLFVEWLYYGDYAIQPFLQPARTGDQVVGIDAECWVLGDKLLCTSFKNHAMKRLYQQLVAGIFLRSVSTHEVQFAFENSAEASKLRQLYADLITTHFGSPHRVQGTVEEWDKLVLNYSGLRQLLLRSFRVESSKQDFLKSEDYYLEVGDDVSKLVELLEPISIHV